MSDKTIYYPRFPTSKGNFIWTIIFTFGSSFKDQIDLYFVTKLIQKCWTGCNETCFPISVCGILNLYLYLKLKYSALRELVTQDYVIVKGNHFLDMTILVLFINRLLKGLDVNGVSCLLSSGAQKH